MQEMARKLLSSLNVPNMYFRIDTMCAYAPFLCTGPTGLENVHCVRHIISIFEI